MSSTVPESSLTSDELLELSHFDRQFADDLDAVFSNFSSGVSGEYINVVDYGAVGDGVTDDTLAIQSAINAAMAMSTSGGLRGMPAVFFPKPTSSYKISQQGTESGNPYCLLVNTAVEDLRFVGHNAKITYNSDAAYAFLIREASLAACKRIRITGLKFVGSGSASYLVNLRTPLFFLTACDDVEVDHCFFEGCSGPGFGSDGMYPGRFHFHNNRVVNCVAGISGNSYSVITDNWFVSDTNTGQGTHWVYLYGPAEGCIVTSNVFINCSKNGIQIRAGSAKYGAKRGFVVAGNTFKGCNIAGWFGSDDDTEVSGFSITGNVVTDCVGAFVLQGLRDSLCDSNQIAYTWQSGITSPLSGAITLSGTPEQAGHLANNVGCRVSNNTLIIRHPFFGKVTLNSIPNNNETITIAGTVYTWKTTAVAPYQIEIQGSIQQCVEALGTILRGDDALQTPQIHIIRDEKDIIFSRFPFDSAATNVLVIVSFNTFAMSTTAGGTAITACIDNRYPSYAIVAQCCIWPVIDGNTCQDFSLSFGLPLERCVSPTVTNNTLIGCSIFGNGNVFSTYRNNKFVLSPVPAGTSLLDYRWLIVVDGFPIIDEDRLLVAQELSNPELQGTTAQVSVGDGRAYTWLWYGTEQFYALAPKAPNSLPFRWNDGDTVVMDDGAANTKTFTFKRISPGAGEFSTIDELKNAINAEGTYVADWAPWTQSAGPASNPKLMLRITVAAAGSAGNSHRLFVTRASTPDMPSYRTVGQVLKNRNQPTTWGVFLGGDSSSPVIKTAFFSPITSSLCGAIALPVDSASKSLNGSVYAADVVPGVGGTITHSAKAGGESWIVKVDR